MMSALATNGKENGLERHRLHPYKFMLWVAMASMVMVFVSLTSAYIVRRAAGNWVLFDLPENFWWNTFVILISSATAHMAYLYLKRNNLQRMKLALGATLLLGTVFLCGQYMGWLQLTEGGITLRGNPSGSFLYLISGMHALHILGGLVFIFVMFIRSVANRLSVKNLLGMELCVIYWHFVDGLWIYLFFFLLLNR